MKKYYLGEEKIRGERIFLELEEDKIIEKINIGDVVYAEDIKDIETYEIEYAPSDESFSVEELEGYTITWIKEFTSEQLEQIEEGEVTDEIIKIMRERGCAAGDLETYSVYEYWNGSNHKEIVLEGYGNEEVADYTEELENMQEIDYKEYSTGNYTLYKLKNDYHALVDDSHYQGSLPSITFIYEYDIETIDKALKYIEENYQ